MTSVKIPGPVRLRTSRCREEGPFVDLLVGVVRVVRSDDVSAAVGVGGVEAGEPPAAMRVRSSRNAGWPGAAAKAHWSNWTCRA
jgi:hypothetical protein